MQLFRDIHICGLAVAVIDLTADLEEPPAVLLDC